MEFKLFTYDEKGIKPGDLKSLYTHVGWWPERREQDIEKMLKATISIGAWQGDTLIGFARAVSDGVFRAYIEDVVVHKDYRKQGVGEQMMMRLSKELKDIHVVSLFCEDSLIPFYKKSGFTYSSSQQVMHRK